MAMPEFLLEIPLPIESNRVLTENNRRLSMPAHRLFLVLGTSFWTVSVWELTQACGPIVGFSREALIDSAAVVKSRAFSLSGFVCARADAPPRLQPHLLQAR